MISFIFFAVVIGVCCAILLETTGDEIRGIYYKAVDKWHGNPDTMEQMRAFKQSLSPQKRR